MLMLRFNHKTRDSRLSIRFVQVTHYVDPFDFQRRETYKTNWNFPPPKNLWTFRMWLLLYSDGDRSLLWNDCTFVISVNFAEEWLSLYSYAARTHSAETFVNEKSYTKKLDTKLNIETGKEKGGLKLIIDSQEINYPAPENGEKGKRKNETRKETWQKNGSRLTLTEYRRWQSIRAY